MTSPSLQQGTLAPGLSPRVAIACGGTGGHLFPGLAVAEQLGQRGCAVTLLISNKEVDQKGIGTAPGMEVVALPAVGLVRGGKAAFVLGFIRSFFAARKLFRQQWPQVALGMGGFTSAPPLLAAKALGIKAFLHESNAVPGRANRWLSSVVDVAYVAFPEAATQLTNPGSVWHRLSVSLFQGLNGLRVTVSGTPVRRQFFQLQAAESCRTALGLDSRRPVVLVMGGSQGAEAINSIVTATLPLLAGRDWQWLHLTGAGQEAAVRQSYVRAGIQAVVHPFLSEMELALGAATAAISRAGGSSLAELAAAGLPSILIPYPAAADNHQFFNAKAFEQTGAACLVNQNDASPQTIVQLLSELAGNELLRQKMRKGLELWQKARAAEQIAEAVVAECRASSEPMRRPITPNSRLKSSRPTQIAA